MLIPLIRVWAVNGTKVACSDCRSRSRRLKRCFASTTMLRPSGVSSASEESWAASARVFSSTPCAGRNAEAWRLPRVMVPVLSSSRTSTSPAASTARPLVAITFAPSMRLIPATPIADSRPPIVVGIRHTSSATSTVTLTALPLQAEKGQMVAVASRNTRVRAISRIVRAISFGVLRRWAPSTIAIIRSRKVSPGLTLQRITSQSERIRVPPVTEAKSPPDSRITGADSPVMALSSTDAPPSITSPSQGIISPASTSTTSPLRRSSAGTWSICASCCGARSLRAKAVFLTPFKLLACALLRPSAIASAKLANRTVNHSQRLMAAVKPALPAICPLAMAIASRVVSRLPIQTINITGLRHCTAGLSFFTASSSAWRTSVGSSRANDLRLITGCSAIA